MTPRPFPSSEPQRLLTEHLLAHPHALGFVGVGIGKTAATLDAINRLFQRGETRGVLILAPMRVANLTWPNEVREWDDFRWMKVANLRTQAGKRAFKLGLAQLYVCNFEGIPNLLKLVKELKGRPLPYDTVVADESTFLKSPTAKRPRAYKAHVPHESHKRIWALTGTPAPNSLLDLWAQVHFVDKGKRLGPSYELYKQAYFKQSDYMGYKWKALPESDKEIHERISDITITLRSKEWLKLPETVLQDVDVPLTPEALKHYREFEKELVLDLQESGAQVTAANAAALVSKLLQFTSGAVYDAEKKWHRVHDLKLKALAKVAKEADGPVLVACGFRHEQARIREAFPKARFFDDAKTPAAQLELLRAWNAKEVPMLVAHPRSIGHGLNMQKGGNTLVWFTLTYSRENYEQMIGRLERRGQDSVVIVYRLMCPDTVDYAVATAIEEKKETEDRLLTALQLLESYREKPLKRKLVTTVKEDWE